MDLKGYEQVVAALAGHNIKAAVEPMPEEGQDVPYVSIVGEEGRLVASTVLNALDHADVGEDRGMYGRQQGPELVLKTQSETTLTFVDRALWP